ncbi:phage tail tape measure protein [uncultured Mediterranean phage uvMED]|nr:phage tail tape measure protein [uncultured Mediterranean phage uvMED]BAR24596.1 phage tail tape measure protein [uncultured Mediterranean phage uvMED]
MAYRAEIEIGVKGANRLRDLQHRVSNISKEIDLLGARDLFENKAIQNIQTYNKTLKDAADNLKTVSFASQKAAKATSTETAAVEAYVDALLQAGDAQTRQNRLIDEEITRRTGATQALKAYNAELAAPTQRGAQTTMAGSYLRGQPTFGPEPAPGFDPVAGAARTRAAVLASEAIAKGREAERLAQKQIELVGKVNQADRRAFIELNNDKIRGIQKRLDAEIDAIGTKLSAAIKADNAEGAKFDQELARRIRVTTEAEKIYLQIREDSEKRIEARRRAGLAAAKKLEQDIARQKTDRQTRRSNAISSGLIGGAFPLLFGQGGGAAIGGGIGGFAGGMIGGQMGFALSLVGTQFGAFADQIVAGGAELGQALNPLTADIEALADAAGFAGTETGVALQAIEQLGTQQQALEAATALLAATVGNEGVDALNSFGAETADLGNEFARAMTQMQTAAARFFAGIPGFIAKALKAGNDLQAGLNLDTPEARELQERRNELTGVDTVGAAGGIGGLSAEDTKELLSIENKLRALAQGKTEDAERLAKTTSEQLQTTQFLSTFGIKNAAITKTELALASQKKDLTNTDYVTLLKIQAAQELSLKNKKAEEAIDKNQSQFLKTNGSLQEVQNKNLVEFNNKIAQIERDSEEAVDRKNKKIERGSAKLGKQAEQARALTATLERQLAQSKVAGTEQAKKLAIEQKYEQTLERIAKLKDQSKAPEQIELANQIKRNAEAKLAVDQEQRRAKALRDAVAPLKQIQETQAANLASSKEYNRLIMEGVLPAEAKRIVEYNKQAAALIRQQDELIRIAELKLVSLDIDSEQAKALRKRIDDLKEERGLIEGKAAEGPGKGKTPEERIKDQIAVIQGGLNDLLDPTNQIIELSTQIGDAFSESFKGIIDGSMSAREALANLFQRTADHFLDMATKIIAYQIKMQALNIGLNLFGGGAGGGGGGGLNIAGIDAYMADGGSAKAGGSYIVGERGPELFVPNTSGTVVPNNQLGGGGATNVVVNVDAKGSSASGDTGAGKQLGGLIGAAVQAELIKQQRPGGLLSR